MIAWIAGYNVAGYLPDGEPEVFDNYSDGVNHILDVLLEWNDMRALDHDEEEDGPYDDDDYLSVVSEIEGQRVNGAEVRANFDGHVFWVYPLVGEV